MLKLGSHMDSGLMYCVYWNQGQGPITFGVQSHDRFYNLQKNEKLIGVTIYHQWTVFVIDFSVTVKAVKLKLSTHMNSGLMYYV